MRLVHRIGLGTIYQVRLGHYVWISWRREPFAVGSRLVVWAWHRRLWP